MSFVYSLSGKNLDLAEAEIEGFLRSQNIEENLERKKSLGFTDSEPTQLRRLAMTKEVSKLINRTKTLETDYRPESSFAVRAEDISGESDTKNIEKRLGSILKTEENTVDLEDPKETIKVYILEDEFVVTKKVLDIDRGLFNKRKNQKRPFSSPVSLDPILARVLVNLSEVPAGGSVLDPFCGTGGILIEAGLCGIKTYGADMQKEMVEGTRENLEEYGILNHDIRTAEIDELELVFDQSFDAVVTDLPYGNASKKEGLPVDRFLEKASSFCSGKVVFMSNKNDLGDLEPSFEIYVHKNLTRYIYLL